jgi:hypothetical protein
VAPRIQHQQAVHPVDHLIELVLDDYNGVLPIRGESPQEAEQVGRRLGIEIRGGLVEHQDVRPHGENRSQGHSLFLSARERSQEAFAVADQTYLVERSIDCSFDLCRSPAQVLRSERDLVLHSEGAELSVGILEYQPGLLGKNVHWVIPHDQTGYDNLAHVVTLDQVRDEPVQAQGQRALARPARPKHQYRLARRHREGQVGQGRLDPGGVGERQPGCCYQRRGDGDGQIRFTLPEPIASPESTPVLAKASPRSWDRPPPSATELITMRTAASPMLPQL